MFGKFFDLLPAVLMEEGGELQWGPQRQGKIPDFQITFPTPEGPVQYFAELKVVIMGVSVYPRRTKGKGTDRRVCRLTKECYDIFRGYDVRFHEAEPWLQNSQESHGDRSQRPDPYWLASVTMAAWALGRPVTPLSQPPQVVCRAAGGCSGVQLGPGQLDKLMGESRRVASV